MYDIIFIGTDTNYSRRAFKRFQNRFPLAKSVFENDVQKAFVLARKKVFTKMYWIVWGDLTVSPDFNFNYQVPEWDLDYVHSFLNYTGKYDGISLIPKNRHVGTREISYRFFLNTKKIDIIACLNPQYDIFHIDTHEDYLKAIDQSTTVMTWLIPKDVVPATDFKFDLMFDKDGGELELNHVFKNQTNDGLKINGIMLVPSESKLSKREIEFRYPVQNKEYDIVASKCKPYDVFYIDTYEDYLNALKKSTTPMTWLVPKEVVPLEDFKFDLVFDVTSGEAKLNHVFKNQTIDDIKFNGIMLVPSNSNLSKREIEYRFPVQRKEYDVVASRYRYYDLFYVDTHEDYLKAIKKSTTVMTWLVPKDTVPKEDFKFNLMFVDCYDDTNGEVALNHVFKNDDKGEIKFNGPMLVPTNSKLSRREIEYRFPIQRKEYDIVATRHRPYDVVFISYNELNADANWEKLKKLVPRALRVHGVKGIHQAHIEAAKSVETPMLWVVDGDSVVEDMFNFELLLPDYDEDIVHVWQSCNPINGLKYGYGGIKLLPTDLTLNMDILSTDMTMNISSKFKAMEEVSNITAFNTDAFTTWRSAFRECCKLAMIDNDESLERLAVWCNVANGDFAEYALKGALAGKQYGQKNAANLAALSLINDFSWLQNQFNQQ